MPAIKVTKIAAGAVETSPLELSVELAGAQREQVQLSFSPEMAAQFVSLLNALSAKAVELRKADVPGEPVILTSTRAVSFRANPSEESSQIVLSFYNASGLEFNFSIESQLSDRVCSEIQKAAKETEFSRPLRKH
jgi:hypothetical protein